MKTRIPFTALASAALAAVAAPALAEELTASSWLPQNYAHSKHAYMEMFERIAEETGGDLTAEIFFGGSLLPARTTLSGIGDGVADLGYVYAAYTPAELPIQTLLNNAAFVSDDMWTVALAYTEFNYTNADAIAEWERHNVIMAGAHATPLYNILCNTEVTTPEQARGKRMRTAGESFSGLVTSLGGTPVSVPIGDAYSGIQRGSLDCVIADPNTLVSYSFNDVVTDVTTVPLGVVTGAIWAFNKDSWEGLSEAHKALLKEEMAVGIVRTHMEFDRNARDAFAEAETRGVRMHEAGPELARQVEDYKTQYLETLVADANGIEGQAILDEFAVLQQTWAERLEGIDRTDEEALLAVVREHLMSKFPF
ncbi:C4-dicarboxylate TRAP transporter substrate-binding protein [Celeribacter indicus]|uniref:TRAP dicarboxylate transporter-DctP subunit n=1 Tax=Celeribacter indicus TaxID=1208324 RepID=A0A0B5E080_9RHOB|nr:C4-dicarboxylate TRAP transporter substrate-binding protein [Celeribacter indicus]AJE46805.1 TRAP dicarboxylate transporter- DctP subunit [Celeribacter indicus]SDW81495.1 TRAP-type C4-dicarboxylate transport system, substrate-binding protein [Celeribacter indicus]